MSVLQIISLLMGQLALITRDPALGYRGAALTETLGLLGTLITQGEAARAELEKLAAQIQQMAASGQEPSKVQYLELRDLSRLHHQALNPAPPESDNG